MDWRTYIASLIPEADDGRYRQYGRCKRRLESLVGPGEWDEALRTLADKLEI